VVAAYFNALCQNLIGETEKYDENLQYNRAQDLKLNPGTVEYEEVMLIT